MKAKKILASLIASIMVLSTMVCPAFAEGNVAKIGETEYETLQAAIDAAESDADITLVADTTEAMVTIREGKNVDIDFAGKTLYGSMLVAKGAEADTKGGSIVQSDTVAGIEVQGAAVLTNMNIESARHAIRVDGLNTEGTSIVINSGKYQTKAPTGWTAHTINAGEGSTVTIKGGTFIGAGEAAAGGAGNCVMVKDNTTTVNIENGTFYGANGVEGAICPTNTLKISGGIFDKWSYDNYLAEGKAVTKEGDNYKVVDAVAKIGTKNYGTLADAVENATNSANITLIADTTEAMVTVKSGKNVTIDFADKTLYGSMFVEKGATADIKNGTIIQTDVVSGIEVQGVATLTAMNITSARHAVRVDGLYSEGTSVTINSGTYTTNGALSGSYYAVNAGEQSTVSINGGKFVGNGGGQGAFIVKTEDTLATIKGGEFYNGDAIIMQVCNSTVITGGKYGGNGGVKPADGYTLVYNDAESVYEVVKVPVTWTTATDAGYFMEGETKKGLMRYLFNVSGKDIKEIGVESTMGSKKTSTIETIVTGGADITFGFDFIFTEAEAIKTAYTLKGYATINGEMNYSEEITNTPNWSRELDYKGGNE